jgi:DNA-binding response OmpR family regulator
MIRDRTRTSILFVDDDPGTCVVAHHNLTEAGFRCVTASDGHHAIVALGRQPFQVVIIDMLMPEKEGVETIMEMRKGWPAMKILAISGGGRTGAEDILRLARAIGADATLKKPFIADALIRSVWRLLEREEFEDGAKAEPRTVA